VHIFEISSKEDPHEEISAPGLELVGRVLFWRKFGKDPNFYCDSEQRYWERIAKFPGSPMYRVLLVFLANRHMALRNINSRVTLLDDWQKRTDVFIR
jgi:hypothetical protein